MGYDHETVKIFMPAGADAPVYAPYVEHYPPDVQAQTWWLKNRQPALWRDKQEVAISSNDSAEQLARMTDEQRLQWAMGIAARARKVLSRPEIDYEEEGE